MTNVEIGLLILFLSMCILMVALLMRHLFVAIIGGILFVISYFISFHPHWFMLF